jgi:hypothetical protein
MRGTQMHGAWHSPSELREAGITGSIGSVGDSPLTGYSVSGERDWGVISWGFPACLLVMGAACVS